MNRIAVVSSSIAAVGYDHDSMTLEVEFLTGSVYQYFDVPEVEFDQLLSAESVGRYFCSAIRNFYRYSKM
ncbi:MAG: KTSC domain-containing protein [Proteobacteria bacterium]|jgi:hypothetical protein|nr:KTSC domain-containing protein [Pseudomonadota bacterium]